MTDTYKTISGKSEGLFKDKGSRFLAFAHNVEKEEEIKEILSAYKKRFHDARHHCFAWQLGTTEKRWRAADDGEPSGTAGKPILNQIQSAGLTNVLIVVIRYFGGVLLGTGGLINAYRNAAADAISKSEIEDRIIMERWLLKFSYESMNEVMKIIKDENLGQENPEFGLDCKVVVVFRKVKTEKLREKFSRIGSLTITEE